MDQGSKMDTPDSLGIARMSHPTSGSWNPHGKAHRTILFLLMPERSAFNASFSLAKQLVNSGYRVLYAGFEGEFEQYVLNQGMAYIAIPNKSVTSQEQTNEQNPDWFQRWKTMRGIVRQNRDLARQQLLECEAILLRERVDLVLLDPLIWPYALPPLRQGTPIISFSTSLSTAYSAHVPPVFSGLTPACQPRWLAKSRNRISWLRHLWQLWFAMEILAWTWSLKYALLPEPSLVSQIRMRGGRFGWSEYGPRLRIPELVAAPGDFDFPECTAASERVYLGNCVDAQRCDEAFEWGGIDLGKPIVYCSLGTYSHVYRHANRLFDAVIESLRLNDDLQGIVQIGTAVSRESFGVLPERIRLVEQVPQIEILSRASIFITHGGLSSVREACYFGVPMLVFPCWNDQPGNAARIEHHKLGIRGDIAQVDVAVITTMLNRALTSEFEPGLLSMKAAFRSKNDGQAAIDLIASKFENA